MRHPQEARDEVRGTRRPATRPRYPRIAAAAGSLLVTLVAVLGGVGLLPVEEAAASSHSRAHGASAQGRPAGTADSSATDGARDSDPAAALSSGVYNPKPPSARGPSAEPAPGVPPDSGTGRRIVFDMARQRVWLVGQRAGQDVVRRTYPVSGSVTDNLQPGTYAVESKSMRAWGVEDSGTMRYMVRFAHGDHAAIGFHDIPVLDGRFVQTREQLGRPMSHGCIRQWRPDARALWAFAPVGTKVVVL
jgi:lipoprotein-anchoring transpeptidase ErfK/SrfK